MKKVHHFPDGREATTWMQSVEQSDKICELLRVGVSQPWIAYHLGVHIHDVEVVCYEWKQNRRAYRKRKALKKFMEQNLAR
jgi:hypothetical protein